MKKFDYSYSVLQTGALTNSDGTNIKRRSNGGIEIFGSRWDQYLEDAIVPEITYTETNATSVDKTVKAWTFYCDSLSGCDSSSSHYKDGDGSKENPWRSLDYALKQVTQKIDCFGSTGCFCFREGKYFQIKIKGVLDYNVSGGSDPDNIQYMLILSPWDSENFTIEKGEYSGVYAIINNAILIYNAQLTFYLVGILFNHCKIEDKNPHEDKSHLFHGYSLILIDTYITKEKITDLAGFYLVSDWGNATFINCEIHNFGIYSDHLKMYNCKIVIDNLVSWYVSEFYIRQLVGGSYEYSCCNVQIYVNIAFSRIRFSVFAPSSYGGDFLYKCNVKFNITVNCQQGYGYADAIGFYDFDSSALIVDCETDNYCYVCPNDSHTCRTPDF